jgi:predicted flap endonuclease-1-like 5' DNA nuclease
MKPVLHHHQTPYARRLPLFLVGVLISAITTLVVLRLRERMRPSAPARSYREQPREVPLEVPLEPADFAPVADFPSSFVTRAEVETVAKSVEAAPEPPAASKKDDLKLIDGIGPRYEQILNEAGITTFAALAETPVERLREVFAASRLAAPDTWPEQAALAAAGNWEGFEALKAELRGGRRV